jgi:hypothetical protein
MSAEAFAHTAELVHLPEDRELGKITGVTLVNPTDFDISEESTPIRIEQVTIDDPNVSYLKATNPGRFEEIQAQEATMNIASRISFMAGGWRRKEATTLTYEDGLDAQESTAYGDESSFTKYFFDPKYLGDAGLQAWQTTIPHAIALDPLTRPYHLTHVLNKKDEAVEATQMTREWMTACTDAQEIRNRRTITVERLTDHLRDYAKRHPDEPITVISVAGGTAEAHMQAINKSGAKNVRLLLLERDPTAIAMAHATAEQIGFTGTLEVRDMDVFDPKPMAALAEELHAMNSKAITADAIGIFEYAHEQFRKALESRKGSDYMLFNPDKFLQAILALVDDEEGMAIIGQMRSDRPNPYFTRGVVKWSGICMRLLPHFADLVQAGGADMSKTVFSLTPVKTYTLASMYKGNVPKYLNTVGYDAATMQPEAPRKRRPALLTAFGTGITAVRGMLAQQR